MPFVFGNAYFDEFCQHVQYISLIRFLLVKNSSFFLRNNFIGFNHKKDLKVT